MSLDEEFPLVKDGRKGKPDAKLALLPLFLCFRAELVVGGSSNCR